MLYVDIIHTISKLSDKKAGELFKHILEYVNDKNPKTDDFVIELAFEPIKQSLKRDLKKYEGVCNRNRANGLLGGRPKNPIEPKEPSGLITNPLEPKKADSDMDSDIDNKIAFSDFWNLYDYKKGKPKSEKKWNSLTIEEQESIIEHLPSYKLSTPDKKYRKYPLTYLNNQSWEDEVEEEWSVENVREWYVKEYLRAKEWEKKYHDEYHKLNKSNIVIRYEYFIKYLLGGENKNRVVEILLKMPEQVTIEQFSELNGRYNNNDKYIEPEIDYIRENSHYFGNKTSVFQTLMERS